MASTGDTASAPPAVLASPGLKTANTLAAGLIVLVMVLAAFYPETFISSDLSIGSHRLTPLTLLLPVVATGAAAFYALRLRAFEFRPVDGVLLTFMAWLLLRNHAGYSAAVALKYIVYGAGLYFMTALARRSSAFSKIFLTSLMIIVCIVSVYGFVDFVLQRNLIFGPSILRAVPEQIDSLHRDASSFAHPVAFGAFLVQVLPFCLYAASKDARRREHLLGIFALVMAAISLFLTFSKGSFIAAGLLALAGLVVLTRKNRKASVVIAVLSAVYIAMLMFSFHNEMGIEIASRSGFSFLARELSWKASIETFAEDPLTGVGLRNGVSRIGRHLDRSQLSNYISLPVDNYYLSLLVEEGALGLLLWLLFLFAIFAYGIRALRSDAGSDRMLTLAAVFSIAGLCLNMVTFDALFMYGNYIFFWVAAGVVRGAAMKNSLAPTGSESEASLTLAA